MGITLQKQGTTIHSYVINNVIGFDTELQLELQINQWSSPSSQSQHMRKSPHMKHCEMISIPLMALLQRSRPAPDHRYNVVRGTGRTAEDDYEVPQNLPPTTTSQPTTTATGDYEPV